MPNKINTRDAFTLAELMIAAVITVLAFVGILGTYIRCMDLSEMASNSSTAVAAVKAKTEEIRNTAFNNIFANYNNVTFTDPNLTGMGVSYVDNTTPDLLQIFVSFSWIQKNGRVVGEDANINGVTDAGEDVDGNGRLDSIVSVATLLFNEN